MIPAEWRSGEVAVLGLARTGAAATRWLARHGFRVYASDAGMTTGPEPGELAGLRDLGVAVQLGGHDLPRITACSLAVVSPGIPPDAPAVAAARNAGVPVVAELELAALALEGTDLVVITGTNGKTTTTAIIGTLLREAGVDSVVAGNIGDPLIAHADENPRWAVVEASSFQLHDCHRLAPRIGVLTNLSPDHLDRYPDVQAYYDDKKRLVRNAAPESVWISDADHVPAREMLAGVPGRNLQWSLTGKAAAFFDRAAARLVLEDARLLDRADLALLGDHNVANALAAALAARAVGVSHEAIAAGLRSVRPLPHRLEFVGEARGMRWVNDSKATNVSSAAVALEAMQEDYLVLMGGRHKGESYAALAPLLGHRHCRGLIAFGEAAPIIERDLRAATELQVVPGLADAVAAAAARCGARTVLLSPACSSFDEFTNYEHRGREFRRLVESL